MFYKKSLTMPWHISNMQSNFARHLENDPLIGGNKTNEHVEDVRNE